MIAKMVILNGVELEKGDTVSLDHAETTFLVKVSALNILDPAKFKDFIQNKYKVLSIERTEVVQYVTAPKVKDFPKGE